MITEMYLLTSFYGTEIFGIHHGTRGEYDCVKEIWRGINPTVSVQLFDPKNEKHCQLVKEFFTRTNTLSGNK